MCWIAICPLAPLSQFTGHYRDRHGRPAGLADTWVNSDDRSSALNYNDYAALVAGPTGVDNILLTFDPSALPEGTNIIGAELMVNVTMESGAFGEGLTALNAENFDSATVTFETAPAVYDPGEPVAAAVGMLSFDVMNVLLHGMLLALRRLTIITWTGWLSPLLVRLVASPRTAWNGNRRKHRP